VKQWEIPHQEHYPTWNRTQRHSGQAENQAA